MKASAVMTPVSFESIDWSRYVDRDLLLALLALIGIGVVMLGSASLWVAERQYGNAYHYLYRQIAFICLGGLLALGMYQIRLNFWQIDVWRRIDLNLSHTFGFPRKPRLNLSSNS